ncbi:MAG: hypothetical protein QOC83_4087, partial [Pseudonocardiales bacterium]|nr:hypothetical protein [Pseudonocardiales bacterium]
GAALRVTEPALRVAELARSVAGAGGRFAAARRRR